ncbi:hypothetical protein EJ06DRAFT_226655 [Trichodelitschia bisporula]|uniref:Uncharacterized protein n=1 Tax=Trichodelitschia bisporula TaxID=703511 RepID=A0A6G1HKR5_9PEZI|nr:hypothetical protein EJ06DRAFT_226655 [Trichodelitschia bisporula]
MYAPAASQLLELVYSTPCSNSYHQRIAMIKFNLLLSKERLLSHSSGYIPVPFYPTLLFCLFPIFTAFDFFDPTTRPQMVCHCVVSGTQSTTRERLSACCMSATANVPDTTYISGVPTLTLVNI